MLTSLRLKGFQSWQDGAIPLGWFTVVTGPTGSGKSGSVRALQLVAFNRRGDGFIARGAPAAVVMLTETDGRGGSCAVAIKRTRSGKVGDLYKLVVTPPGGDRSEETFTKLAGAVPGDVAKVLRLDPKLNFAGQFDMPYLVAANGGDVAKELARLTNVDLVFRASAEAGRRRKGFERDAKVADLRAGQLREELALYKGLPARRKAIVEAEQLADGIEAKVAQLTRLRSLAVRLETETAAAAQLAQVAVATRPPSLAKIEAKGARLTQLRGLICVLRQAQADAERWAAEVTLAGEREQEAHQALHAALVAAGSCPTCGQLVAA